VPQYTIYNIVVTGESLSPNRYQIQDTLHATKDTSKPYSTLLEETPVKPSIIMALPVVSTFNTTEGVSNTELYLTIPHCVVSSKFAASTSQLKQPPYEKIH
jgi:hypothetical protein